MMYGPDMTLGEAREVYFEQAGFASDGGYSERWIKVKVWRIPIWLPNTAGRIRAVKLHDLHHVLTEYPTTWAGEAEISAWEIGSGGLRRFWAGWWLDLMNVAQGLVVSPRGVYRGFMRGRQSKNLYSGEYDEQLLNHLVGEYRHILRLDKRYAPGGFTDHVAFVAWTVTSILVYIASVGPFFAIPALILYWIFLR